MLIVYDINESDKWDNIVKSFTNYDVYYLSGYAKSFKLHGDGEPLLFYYYDESCKGINVVMKRDISNFENLKNKIQKNELFDFSTPYGYGGWLIEGSNTQKLFDEYFEWCNKNNIVSEFVRFHPVLKNEELVNENYDVVYLGNTVNIDITNKDLIWQNFTPKNRNVIRKAINNNIEIYFSKDKEIYDEFIKIYNLTMDKDNATEYYYFNDEFYESIRNDLNENAFVFYAKYQEKIIAASIIIFANAKLNYHLSGSLREYQNLAPSNLLLWKVSEWGNENGYKNFHLGGGVGSKEDSLLHFKKAFYRGELTNYCIGKKIFNLEKYNYLVKVNNNINNNYFPEYRG